MGHEIEIKIPDIGGATSVDVIELLVKEGDEIQLDTPLVTLETDKASMEIPSSSAGIVAKLLLKVGDKVSEGDSILVVRSSDAAAKPVEKAEEAVPVEAPKVEHVEPSVNAEPVVEQKTIEYEVNVELSSQVFAGPSVRRLARELGVSLEQIQGSGRKDRVTKEDIQAYVKARMSEQPQGSAAFSLPTQPAIDFSKFGEIETLPLNKIKKATGANVHRSWVSIPHVTQFDEADITSLEEFRKAESVNSKDYKLTVLAFACKVVCKALQQFPQFNASLDAKGEHLIYKKYYHIGIAVETPNGLVVPVIKDVDKRSVSDIAKEMARLSSKARDKGLMPADMSGGCFTISSLGGIGGTAFTPIVNSPEVAILGLSRSAIKPVYMNEQFVPRLMLPLSLSYDHRVIDGAEAARFTRFIADCFADIRRVML